MADAARFVPVVEFFGIGQAFYFCAHALILTVICWVANVLLRFQNLQSLLQTLGSVPHRLS
jgi:hypothetical protein